MVTVTNQFCSMGRVIARRMSELLGVECYNDYIAKEAALRQVTEMEESRVAYHLNYTAFRPDDRSTRIF